MTKQDTATGKDHGKNICYYYLHQNGDLIYKNKLFDPADFEESPFVVKWWLVDLDNRMDAYNMLIAAKIFGARQERIEHLLNYWGITNTDAVNYIERMQLSHEMDGAAFCVKPPDFIDMMQSPVGFGETLFDAICDLCEKAVKDENYNPHYINIHGNLNNNNSKEDETKNTTN